MTEDIKHVAKPVSGAFDGDTAKAVDKIQKLFAVAAKAGTEAEAAAFTARAMEMMEAYNLDMLSIEQGGDTGKREEAKMMGGMYIYERELWRAIAELNFCMYFRTTVKATHKRRKISFAHRVIGRVVNTAATKAMGGYIQSTIGRLTTERFPQANQYFTREAVAFREGMADKIVERLKQRRYEAEMIESDRKAQQAAMAKKTGVDTRFALTIADVKDSEEIANYDFIHGEGAWKKKQDREERWDKEYAERRARQAKAQAAAERQYAAWAKANPEEAAAEARKVEAEQRKKDKARERRELRGGGYRYREPSARETRQGSDFYDAGYEKGAQVSLEPQVDSRSGQKRIGK